MTDPKIKYDIEANVTGQEDAAQLSEKLKVLGDVLGQQLSQQAQAAAQALQGIADKREALSNFTALKNEVDALGIELSQAEGQLRQVQQQLDAASAATQGYVRAEMAAKAAIEAKRQQVAQAKLALGELEASNTGAARKTDEYRAAAEQARASIQSLSAEIKLEGIALKEAQAQVRAATTEENALSAQRDASLKSLYDAKGALAENTAALGAAQAAAQKLGVDTANLAREEAALTTALRSHAPLLAEVKKATDALAQSEQQASLAAKELRENARKLGAEGVQAPAALEQAFRQLGMAGLQPAQKAIQELQAALAQIRASDVVDSQKQAAITAFNQRIAELRGEASEAATATTRLGGAVDGAGNSLATAAHKAVAWTSALVGMQQLKSIAEQVVQTGAQFETLHVRLSNLLGSTEAANQAFGMLKQLAASTPFDVAGLTESFVKLTAFGMKPTEDQMRSLADVAANLGGGTEALQGVTIALGQAWTKSKLQGEEILQLAERGVPVWDALATATGRTVPELQRMSEAGLLGRDVIAKLIDELGRMNEGASDKLMRTYAGAVANAKDALSEFFDMVAKAGVLDWLTVKIRELLAEFERMKQTGELEQKARELANAFVVVANAADMVAKGLVQIAPVITAAAQAFLALKALQIGQTMLGIASGAKQAAVAVGAAGAAGTAASVGLGAASVAARAFAVAIRLIPGAAALWALGEAAGMLLNKLLGVKTSADDAKKGLDSMMLPPAANGPEVAVRQTTAALTDLEMATDDAVKKFDALMAKGASADDALNQIGRGFDLTNIPGIKAMPAVLEQLELEFKISAEQSRAAWEKGMAGVNLKEFEAMVAHAFAGVDASAKQAQQAMDAGLREAVRRAGLDFNLISVGMGKAATSAVSDLGFLIDNLDRLAQQGADTGRALNASISKAIDTADSEKALEAVRAQIERVREVLGDKIADGLLDQAKKKAYALKDAFDGATGGINSVREAMKQLGVTTDETLRNTAAQSKAAYEMVAASGKASARELSEGFRKAAQDAITASNGVAPAWVQSEAAVRGFRVAVDESGKAVVLSMREAEDATNRVGNAARGAAGGYRDMAGAADRAATAAQRAAAAAERQKGMAEGDPETKESREYDRKAEEAEKAGQHLAAANFRRMADRERHIAEGQQKSRDIRYAAVNDTDINQQIAARYGEEAIDNPLARQAWQLRLQLQAYQKNYGNARSAQSLLEQRNIAAELDRIERELSKALGKEGSTTSRLGGSSNSGGGRSGAAQGGASSSSGRGVQQAPVSLYYNNENIGPVNTDAAGREVIQKFLSALADGKRVSR